MESKFDHYNNTQRIEHLVEEIKAGKRIYTKGNKSKIPSKKILPANRKHILDYHGFKKGKTQIPTQAKYLEKMRNIAFMINKDFRELTLEDIENLVEKIEKTFESTESRSTWVSTLNTFMNHQFETHEKNKHEKGIKRYLSGVIQKYKKERRPRKQRLEWKEVQHIFEANPDIKFRAIFSLFSSTNRFGSIFNMRIQDVDLSYIESHGVIVFHLFDYKSSEIEVPLHPIFNEYFLQYFESVKHKDSKSFLFPSPKNDFKPLSNAMVNRMLREACRKAGISSNVKVNPHSWRGYFADIHIYDWKEHPNHVVSLGGWSANSDVFHNRYSNPTVMDKAIVLGYAEEKEKRESPKLKTCECGNKIGFDAVCKKCGKVYGMVERFQKSKGELEDLKKRMEQVEKERLAEKSLWRIMNSKDVRSSDTETTNIVSKFENDILDNKIYQKMSKNSKFEKVISSKKGLEYFGKLAAKEGFRVIATDSAGVQKIFEPENPKSPPTEIVLNFKPEIKIKK